MKYLGNTDEYFEIATLDKNPYLQEQAIEGQFSMLWFLEDDNSMVIDAEARSFNQNEILFLTSLNNIEIQQIKKHHFLRFNKAFHCIINHDSEVGCRGILFYGSNNTPTLRPNNEQLSILETVWKMLVIEMKASDNLQLEMLQMMLKRILLLSTRMYKSQTNYQAIDEGQTDIVREFNFQVEQHFKEKHSVAEYAALLNKSPKTLSNLFSKLSGKSPLQIIQSRIMLEVRRLLRYTDKPISEIGYEVGFMDIQSFSRFFKKHQGVSPSVYRTND